MRQQLFEPIQVNWNYEAQLHPFHGMFGLPVRGCSMATYTENLDGSE
jgi:hypothetical protein